MCDISKRSIGWLGASLGCWLLVAGTGARADDPKALADQLLEWAGRPRGVCVLMGQPQDLALELARRGGLLVHVRDPRAEVVAELRSRADAAGLGLDRLMVEQGQVATSFPHADNLVDLVIQSGRSETRTDPWWREAIRILRPDGTLLIGAPGEKVPEDWLQKEVEGVRIAGGVKTVVRSSAWGQWLQVSKPALAGAGDWPHWEHGPDNNPVSTDTVIRAPYRTQFLAGPMYIGMPSITTAAAGRTFLAIGHIAHHSREWDTLNKLIARNGHNGTVLWERSLPEGYLVHRSAFIATRDAFYMIEDDHALVLDPQTGQERERIRIPGVDGHWKWMVLDGGVLYVLAGPKDPPAELTKGDRSFGGWSWSDLSKGYYQKQVPWGFGDVLAAFDLSRRQPKWQHTERALIDSRGMSMTEGKIFLYCPGAHLRALDAGTGKILWTNADRAVLDLIEEPGRGLTSTPGFRTANMAVATPQSLIIQGQTRMNVVALSTEGGYLRWTKKKITNNPNAIFVDGKLILGVGPGGSHVVIDPTSGDVLEDLGFRKVACTRLTASSDSFFVRGEGTLRYDREGKKLLVDGSVRPACNDGALPANGLLYLGPWQCDCNLSLIGSIARCSAGDFRIDRDVHKSERLEKAAGDPGIAVPLAVSERDWPTYRANVHRSAGTQAPVLSATDRSWVYSPSILAPRPSGRRRPAIPTAPVAAGGLVFVADEEGKVRALDATSGELKWEFATPCPIKQPPTIWQGRAFFGSGDGFVYSLDAATGRLLWRFRAAPAERYIMVYGSLASTWPVNTGVLVQDGTAYCGAGIIDYDGTALYALDARTGAVRWQNHSAGHLSDELRKGVSAQGNLTILGDRLLLAGGNQVSPAPFDLATGQCLAPSFEQGMPKANGGRFAGVFLGQFPLVGGRILYSSPLNVATKGSFSIVDQGRTMTLNYGGVPPAWDGRTVALVNYQHGKLTCLDAARLAARISQAQPVPPGKPGWRPTLAQTFESDGLVRWSTDMDEPSHFEVVSLAVCPNAVVAVLCYQRKDRAQPQWLVAAYETEKGTPLFQHELPAEPLPDGLLVDAAGRPVVAMLDGSVVCYDRTP